MTLIFSKQCRFFALPTLEEQDKVTNPRRYSEGAFSGGAPGLVEDAVEPVSISNEDNNWELKGVVRLYEAGRVGISSRLNDLETICHANMQKDPETVAKAFALAVELIGGGGSVDILDGSDAHARGLCERKSCVMCAKGSKSCAQNGMRWRGALRCEAYL